jgi:hypothetical protein
MIHSSRRDRKTKAIAEVLAMIADAHPPLAPLRPCPVLETEEWLWESATAERWDCARQIYGLTATRLAEPVCCVTEEDQNTRCAVNRFSRRPGVRGPVRLARQNS